MYHALLCSLYAFCLVVTHAEKCVRNKGAEITTNLENRQLDGIRLGRTDALRTQSPNGLARRRGHRAYKCRVGPNAAGTLQEADSHLSRSDASWRSCALGPAGTFF